MSIILNKEYDFPYREKISTYSSATTLPDYLDEIKNFFVETLEFYYMGRETYNSYLFDFFANNENDEYPCFCIGQVNQSSNNYTLGIIPCSNGIPYKPNHAFATLSYQYIYSAGNAIIFGAPSTKQNTKPVVRYIKFEDGRKAVFFKNKNSLTNTDIYLGIHGVLYFTDIKYNGNNISNKKQWIIFSDAPNTSYISEIEKTASFSQGNPYHQKYYHYLNPRYMVTCGGYIPDMAKGKDFLLKLSHYYIGDDYYLNEISYFSKIKNIDTGIPIGTIMEVDGKEYVILINTAGMNVGYGVSTSITNNATSPWSISLIVPVDLEEE